ncbi:hypothetical protein DFH07DRAFT_952342 [Mycena maculata]|uniref:Uncharacterized protein n=1 Tax=Mycena maculata TaxID=230809 RepID=A0AAD7K0Y5_9AGAR|nr:hypothetical protein DFH07DRAFT_952342 [Mycena maculata]
MVASAETRRGARRKGGQWKRVARKDRRNLRLWAEGARESILKPHIPGYTDALERGWRAERDYLQRVCNEFHAKIPWRMADHEDPDLPLPEYDEFALPAVEDLDEDEVTAKRLRIETMNARLKRPLKMDRSRDPWAMLLLKLAGINSPPKARQAFQQYMHESYETEILPAVTARWAASFVEKDGVTLKSSTKPNAPFRAKVARELFAEVSVSEQAALRQRAKDDAKAAKEEYAAALKRGPSKTPEDRQRCINNLGTFMSAVLRGVCEHTGLHSVVIFGGPMPQFGGELRTAHVSYGRNHDASPCHFPNWNKARFNRDVLEFMKEYLRTAFTPAECTEAALPDAADMVVDPPSAEMLTSNLGFGDDGEAGGSNSDESDSDDSEGASDTESDTDSELEGDLLDVDTVKGWTGKGKRKRDEKEKRPRKKRREVSGAPSTSTPQTSSALPPPPPVPVQEMYMPETVIEQLAREREYNIACNNAALRQLNEDNGGDGPGLWDGLGKGRKKKNTASKSNRAPRAAVPTRRLARCQETDSGNVEIQETAGTSVVARHPSPQNAASVVPTSSTILSGLPATPPTTNVVNTANMIAVPLSSSLPLPLPNMVGAVALPLSSSLPAPPPNSLAGSTALAPPQPASPPLPAASSLPTTAAGSTTLAPPTSAAGNTVLAPPHPSANSRIAGGTPTSNGVAPPTGAAQAEYLRTARPPPAGMSGSPTSADTPPESDPSAKDGEGGEGRPQPIPPCPSNAAAWFVTVYPEISRMDLGVTFNALLKVLIELEEAYNWANPGGKGLGTMNRLAQIAAWVAAGWGSRGGSVANGVGPPIRSIASFATAFWQWWGQLQPRW